MQEPDNERWLTDGDCTKCRRQNYCSKPCRRNIQTQQAQLTMAVASSLVHALSGKYHLDD